MPVLEDVVRSLWLRCGPSLRLLYEDGFTPLKVHPHLLLIDALKHGDPKAARAAIELDLRHAGEHILHHIEVGAAKRQEQRLTSSAAGGLLGGKRVGEGQRGGGCVELGGS